MGARAHTSDHWSASLDHVEALRARMTAVSEPQEDAIARRLMAQVAHEKSSSFIALLDRDGFVLDVNPAALIAGGMDRAEVVGLPLWATAWWSETDAERSVRDAVEESRAGRLARFDIDVRHPGATGIAGTLDLILRPLRARDGQVTFIVAEGRTVTDRKRVEERLAQQNAELTALAQRLATVHDFRERLLSELSHDLRAPLQAVVTRADQVLRTEPGDELRGQLASIRLAALGALEQINDMLEQVKADHGEARLSLADTDLARVVRAVVDQFAALASERTITLELEAPARVTARFDVERMSRIVSNLLANAIRHTPGGGIIRCRLTAAAADAVLTIADSGPGIPATDREQVFARFHQGDGRLGGAGAGLGLAVAREFAELHGGSLTVGEGPDGGAQFTVTLPLRPPDGLHMPATISHHAAAAQRTEFVRSQLAAEFSEPAAPPVPTVLIVERAPALARVLAQAVSERAVPCIVETGAEALRLAGELLPETIVVGSVYDMTATSLLRQLAARERLGRVRRLALVGEREHDATPHELLAAGAQLALQAADASELGARLWGAARPATRR